MYVIGHQSYSAALRLKQGEYLGVNDVASDVADRLLIHWIAPPPKERDPEKGRALTPDEMIHETGRRVGKYWPLRPCLLDVRYLFEGLGTDDAKTWLSQLFRVAADSGARAIPAFALRDFEGPLLSALLAVIDVMGVGLAIRVTLADLVDPFLRERLHNVLVRGVRAKPDQCLLILDLSDAEFSLPGMEDNVAAYFAQVSEIGLWNSVIFQGTNYPESNPAPAGGSLLVPRREWQVWRSLAERDPILKQRLMFGDFAADSAKFKFGGKARRTIPHYRFALPESWWVLRACKDEPHGEAMARIAKEIVESDRFPGIEFSVATEMIAATAALYGGPGNATTWRRINTCQHLTRVITDLGSFHGYGIEKRAQIIRPEQFSLFDQKDRGE